MPSNNYVVNLRLIVGTYIYIHCRHYLLFSCFILSYLFILFIYLYSTYRARYSKLNVL